MAARFRRKHHLRERVVQSLPTAAPRIELSGSACSLLDAEDEIESQYPDLVVVDGNDCSPEDIRAVYARLVQSGRLASGVSRLGIASG